jgi:H+/Cl- antiporter ClcA
MKLILSLLAAAVLSSIIAGLFIESLNVFVALFLRYWQWLLWATPAAGLAIFGLRCLKPFRNCEEETSPMLTPFIFLTACWSQLFGASTGREGAAIQIGPSIAEFIRRRVGHEEGARWMFAHVGSAAAFAAAFGTPWSAILFAMEYKRKPSFKNLLASFCAAWIGFEITGLMRVHHWIPPKLISLDWTQLKILPCLILIAVLFVGVAAYFFLERKVLALMKKCPFWLPLVASGTILTLATLWLANPQFNNFGIVLLNSSFVSPTEWNKVFGKTLFTFISLTGGWQGGSFIPLMACGAMMGSAITWIVGLPYAAGAGMGLFCFVNKKFHIPLTSILLSGEILGWKFALLSAPLHLLILFFL